MNTQFLLKNSEISPSPVVHQLNKYFVSLIGATGSSNFSAFEIRLLNDNKAVSASLQFDEFVK